MRTPGANSKARPCYIDKHVDKNARRKRKHRQQAESKSSKIAYASQAKAEPRRTEFKRELPRMDASPAKASTLDEAAYTAAEEKRERKRANREFKRQLAEEAKRLNEELEKMANDYSQSADLSILYPTANLIERSFEIHVGPTNSGKTHSALEELKKARSGAYLAPLRLLAIEVEQQLVAAGLACSLVTGEERDIKEGQTHISSTVEMADFSALYDVAVIDECQMVSDKQRGGGWTAAISGLAARKIHLCTAPEGLETVISLVESLSCPYEVVEHERACPLVVEAAEFSYPADVQPGDALVAFSRRDVLHIAGELKRSGTPVSVIYGALPYAARREEVRKFADGESQVVVATDAIGMGLNLPIRRVIFMNTVKFDGIQRRKLTATEVRQIAGRAGRFGKYDIGYVNAVSDKSHVAKMLNCDLPAPSPAVLAFPKSFLRLDLPISKMMDIWSHAQLPTRFLKADVSDQAMLARIVEFRRPELSKEDVYRLSMIPFDVKDRDLIEAWSGLVGAHGEAELVREVLDSYVADISRKLMDADLATSEFYHRLADLCYSYRRSFGMLEAMDELALRLTKDDIALHIIDLLGERNTYSRQCKYCGDDLPWNYPYGMCQDCYNEMYGYRKASSFY